MLLALSLILFSAWEFSYNANGNKRSVALVTDDSAAERDILPAILAINNDKENKPKTDFKRGHVKQRTLKKIIYTRQIMVIIFNFPTIQWCLHRQWLMASFF